MMEQIRIETIDKKKRTPELMTLLVHLWEQSMSSTHHFLSEKEKQDIKEEVPEALKQVSFLLVVFDENNKEVAFLGIEKTQIEMLFVSPNYQKKGIGKKLIALAKTTFHTTTLTVNEQNEKALTFYKKMGFVTYKRTNTDEQGRPYPLLYMKSVTPH